jgi:aminopeptidase N
LRFPLARYASSVRFALLPAALTLAAVLPHHVSAQWTLKNVAPALNDTWEGAMQASDGNFYTTSIITSRVTTASSCQDNPANSCSYITKITPDGTATLFHTFYEVDGQNNVDGMSPNPIIEASDGNFYGSTLTGGRGASAPSSRSHPPAPSA